MFKLKILGNVIFISVDSKEIDEGQKWFQFLYDFVFFIISAMFGLGAVYCTTQAIIWSHMDNFSKLSEYQLFHKMHEICTVVVF